MWIHGDHWYGSGSGMAGGYGFGKGSTAAEQAINSVGYQLSERIGGAGYSTVKGGLIEIAKTLTENPVYIIEMFA